jgi:N-methylhydantoinase A
VIEGPAAIEEPSTTTILEPGDRATVDGHGFLRIRIGG